MKRLFDIFFSFILLVLFLPLAFLISIFILLEGKGGVFYFQERIGKNGMPFKLFKFRTMKINADKEGKLTIGMKDARITKIGYFLRKFKLDEFPQFINVLIGDMSIVGPRPEVKEYVDLYSDEQRRILSLKPGITDYASIEYFEENKLLGNSLNPKETYINEIMPAKIELSKKYLHNHSIFVDLKIILLTVKKIIS